MWKPKLNPITQKRLKRFTSIRRSYWSLWILLGLYGCGLLANLISNDKPLFVRYEGASYFPIIAYYPDDVFSGSGLQTRPDYKKLNQSEAFAVSDGNYMIFAPMPYGPFETLEANEVVTDETIHVSISRKQKVATVNLNADLTIARSVGFALFAGVDDERDLRGEAIEDYFAFPSVLAQAKVARFQNDVELPAVEELVAMKDGTEIEVSLSPYRPRSRAPASVRVSIREVVSGESNIELDFLGGSIVAAPAFWEKLDQETKKSIEESVSASDSQMAKPLSVAYGDEAYKASFSKEEVSFPFRPTARNWFGLDSSGRDVFSRILYGLRIALNFSILLVIAGMVIGIFLGGLQGFKGGKTDLVGQRLTEIWEALPFLYIMIFMGSVFGRSFLLLLVIYGAFSWIGMSYYMRGEFLKLRKQPFVEAAHCLGLPGWKIMLRHILPNSLVPVITFFPFSLVGAIFSLSALDFLGFGLPTPTPSWGELLAQAQEFKHAWWLVLYPSLALFVVILLSVFIGDGIRAAFDPRVNSKYES